MKILLIPVFLILLIPLISNSEAVLVNLENTEVFGEDESTGSLIFLEFGYYDFTRAGKLIPTINDGFIELFGDSLDLKNAVVKQMGSSFVVTEYTPDYKLKIYAINQGNENYKFKTYFVVDNKLFKRTFHSITDMMEVTDITESPKITKQPEIELLLTGNYQSHVSLKETIYFAGRLFDGNLNPLQEHTANIGYIPDAKVILTFTDKDNEIRWQEKTTTDELGHFGFQIVIINDFRLVDEYNAQLFIEYQELTLERNYPLYILEQGGDKRFSSLSSTRF